MPPIRVLLNHLLPGGTEPAAAGEASWSACPPWPPDVFAVAATIAERSACYARDRYGGQPGGLFDGAYLERVRVAGAEWRSEGRTPDRVAELWRVLLDHEEVLVGESLPSSVTDATMELMAIADESCVGVGFAPNAPTPVAAFVLDEHRRFAKSGSGGLVRDPRVSLCIAVPPDRACVQPKSRAAQVGCTLRALTHHLALVPGVGEVETRWMMDVEPRQGPFNVLCVPFPYRMTGDCVRVGSSLAGEGRAGRFELAQRWLPASGAERIDALSNFVLGLVRAAEPELGAVHGVVLPELALDSASARGVARALAQVDSIELFIAGSSARYPKSGAARNMVFGGLFSAGQLVTHWWQSKHHRWRLEESQIRRYHLGHVLDPSRSWWEDIDVDGRQLSLYVFRPDACIAVLVCEDLARIDPVQPVLRAIGPSLVIAVLMDGPQLDRRWPGRYAGALADDPGCSVLTLSSLAMLERSVMPGEPAPRQIALFKDASGVARELSLPRGAHALALSLDLGRETRHTLDGRSDGKRTVTVTLGAVRAVAHPSPPDWLGA